MVSFRKEDVVINQEYINKVYQGASTADHFAIRVDDLNRTFMDEISRIGLGAYGEQLHEAFFPVYIALIKTDGRFTYEADAAIEKVLRSGNPHVDNFVRQMISNYGLIQGICTTNDELIRESLQAGANPNAQSLYQGTRITSTVQAALTGNSSACKLLLESGANPDLSQTNSESPLAIAANNGYVDICEMLLNAGADPNKMTYGGTALAVAENVQVMRVLVNHGADVNIPDGDGDLPIIGCIDVGDYEGVEFLKQAGTDINRKNKWGVSALDHARRRGDFRMIEILSN